jgi:hypothetical protein
MRRFSVLAALVLTTLASAGCLINPYSSDPQVRMEQLIFQSEDLRQIENEWRRIWFTDQPSHLTYERAHGGIGP